MRGVGEACRRGSVGSRNRERECGDDAVVGIWGLRGNSAGRGRQMVPVMGRHRRNELGWIDGRWKEVGRKFSD